MTWQGLRRKQLPSDWAHRRKARLELDGYRCTAVRAPHEHPLDRVTIDEARRLHSAGEVLAAQRLILDRMRCPEPATEVHHALAPDDHDVAALRSLCHAHHDLHTQAEAAQARAKKPKQRRATRPHPGLTNPGGGPPPR